MYDWKYRLFAIIPWGLRQEANWLAVKVDFDTGGDKTFGSMRLSADGNEPPSHTGCNGVIPIESDELQTLALAIKNNDPSSAIDVLGTEGLDIKSKIQAVMQERGYTKNQIWNAIKQCRFYVVGNTGENDGKLIFSTANVINNQAFSWADALTDAGLQEIPAAEV